MSVLFSAPNGCAPAPELLSLLFTPALRSRIALRSHLLCANASSPHQPTPEISVFFLPPLNSAVLPLHCFLLAGASLLLVQRSPLVP